MERKAKQVIVMRKDLNMRKGKMVAQGAHASLKVILDKMNPHPNESLQEERTLYIDRDSPLDAWINGLFTKICLGVDSEADLVNVYRKAGEAGLPCALIKDAGLTEFNGVPTLTCCAIGPAWSEDIDKITGELKTI
jgi:PTH2 family peptidyl-tRNA hydrolase